MTLKPTIFLDLDGVIADFASGVRALYQHPTLDPVTKAQPLEVALGITEAAMWNAVYEQGVPFWINLQPLPWAHELYKRLCAIAPVCFLTSPCEHGYSAHGKIQWLKTFTGDAGFRDFIITPQKQHCARPNAVLVDDFERQVDKFRVSGGKAVLVPGPYNSAPEVAVGRVAEYVADEVVRLLGPYL